MAHPLNGARKRVERADKHLREAIAEIDAIGLIELNSINVYHDAISDQLRIDKPELHINADGLSLIVSDCIHNLRSALDFLVFELARSDSGSIQSGTQFPIEDSPTKFTEREKTYLKGLTRDHIDAIRALQPCEGTEWTRTLRTISNPDKHRHLTVLRSNQAFEFICTAGPLGSFVGMGGKVFPHVVPGGSDLHVQRGHPMHVAFGDRGPVVETLEILKSQVSATIESFEAEVKPYPV